LLTRVVALFPLIHSIHSIHLIHSDSNKVKNSPSIDRWPIVFEKLWKQWKDFYYLALTPFIEHLCTLSAVESKYVCFLRCVAVLLKWKKYLFSSFDSNLHKLFSMVNVKLLLLPAATSAIDRRRVVKTFVPRNWTLMAILIDSFLFHLVSLFSTYEEE